MKLFFIGDVVGALGCEYVRSVLPAFKARHGVDVVIANGENSAEGNGIRPADAEHLWASGVDVITTGNHVLRRREIFPLLEQNGALLRPLNYHSSAPGSGVFVLDKLRYKLCVVNLVGVTFMSPAQNPFEAIDEVLKGITTPNIVVDFHAEATSEKRAMGFYLAGRVSAVVGTHTHVQTADEQILEGHTAYITDVGMCGGLQSVLGVQPKQAIERFRTGMPVRFENVKEQPILGGMLMEIDEKTGAAASVTRVTLADPNMSI